MSTATAIKVIDLLLAAMELASEFQVNWGKVKELQDRARAENRQLNADERQELIDDMLDSVGGL